MGATLNVFCPFCGTRLIDGEEATKVNLTCKRCKTKLNASFDTQTVHLEIAKTPVKEADSS